MRRAFLPVIGAALLVSACSSGDERGSTTTATEDSVGPPNVSPTAAPGVAFRYSYLFEIPDEAIATVQEGHAARCEALGVGRCRITGLQYNVSNDDTVSASLEVKLAPEVARQFGKEAAADVAKADGKLRETEFTGEDTEPVTTEASSQRQAAEQRIAELERQLQGTGRDAERAEIQRQIDELRSQIEGARLTIASAQRQLATTPMRFTYYGRGGISGFKANPIREAGRSFVTSIVTLVTVVLQLLAYVLPWALLLAGLIWLLRTRPGRSVRDFLRPKEQRFDGE